MLYFPIIQSHYPNWLPVIGGRDFEFFSPVFNIADASISTGVIAILIFQTKFFKHHHTVTQNPVVETNTKIDDNIGVL
jgi:signal peptidase II